MITSRTFDVQDCEMITQMLQENNTKGSCIIALQICLQSSLNEFRLGKMNKRQLLLYSTSRVKHLIQPFIQQIGGWQILIKPKSAEPININTNHIPNLAEWQQRIPNHQMSKMMMLITLIMSLLNPTQGIDVYDCDKPKFGRIYSLLYTRMSVQQSEQHYVIQCDVFDLSRGRILPYNN